MMIIRKAIVAIVGLCFVLAACGKRQPLPQPRRVVDPASVSGAIVTPEWELAAVPYAYSGEGIDYLEAGVLPVFLVVRNIGELKPELDPAETRGVAADGEYLPYSITEAEQRIFDSEAFSNTASNVARTGSIGALAGAGLGALIGLVGGGDNIWKGAVIGGAVGGAAGGVYGGLGSESELKRFIKDDLDRYAWDTAPIPSDYTKVGYVYMPNNVGITQIKVVVRADGKSHTYILPFR